MTHDLRTIVSANKAAQNHATLVRAAVVDTALRARDIAAPGVHAAVTKVRVAGVYAGAFLRTLVGK